MGVRVEETTVYSAVRLDGKSLPSGPEGHIWWRMSTPPFGVPVGTSPEKIKEALRADVARRLRNVCSDWEQGDFERLVDDVTTTAMKYLKPAAN